MDFSITLNELRTQYQDEIETDPKTGIRYTVDTLGNPIIIAPDKPAGELGIGEEPTYEKAAKSMAPETREFEDVGGKTVRLQETDIRPYLFDPTLIQREADLALLSGIVPGEEPIGTALGRGEFEGREKGAGVFVDPFTKEGEVAPGEGGFTRLMPGAEGGEERISEEETQKIKEASQRIDQAAGIAPPGGPGLPETGDIDWFDPKLRDNYKAHIEQKMGGNPNTINPQEEVMKLMPDSKVQTWYADNWVDGMPTWYDLSKSAQAQVGAKLRSDLLSQYKREVAAKSEVYNQLMAEFDKKQADHQKALKYIQSTMKAQKKEVRAQAKEEETALYRLNRSKANREKIQKALDESFSDEAKIRLQDQLKSAGEEVRHYQTLVDQEKPKPKGGAKGTEKPVSTTKQTGLKPDWAPENATAWVETAKGKFYKVTENGKEVTYPAKEAK